MIQSESNGLHTTPPPALRPRSEGVDDLHVLARRDEYLIDALKLAIESPREHRLYRWGKLTGLFPSRVGASGEASTRAVQTGLLEVSRTEIRGKLIVEWVRATPKALAYVHDHDSPKAVLRELRGVLGATRSAIPGWMEQARDEAAQLALRFEHRARDLLERLEKLSASVDAALRRAEAAKPAVSAAMAGMVPWAIAALEYLDRRTETIAGDCPLPDLFRAMLARFPDLTLPDFQSGLRHLHDTRALRLRHAEVEDLSEPEFAFVVENELVGSVTR